MKILVLQLARLGDIYQTWPVLRALHRSSPQAEIHLLTRSKFAAAAPVAEGILKRHWCLDTRQILEPLIDEKPDVEKSLQELGVFVENLKREGFERIVNLSFSPFSSYLVREVATHDCDVRGYTRFEDGTLCIPDDPSAYFYAQVGVGGANRIHITDLFANIAGVELVKDDWRSPLPTKSAEISEAVSSVGSDSIVIHIGASDPKKTFSWSKWSQIIKGLSADEQRKVVLVGSSEEGECASRILANLSRNNIINLVGQTNLDELTEIIRRSALLIGGDSAPVQIASLIGTPILNISFPTVNFWETGPRAAGSRVVLVADEASIGSDAIVLEAQAILNGGAAPLSNVRVPGPTFPYVETRPLPRSFDWQLLKAVYMSEQFPVPESREFLIAIDRLTDLNHLAREQIDFLRSNPYNKTAASILDQIDGLMDQIVSMVPEISPIVAWFRTERLRIGPMDVSKLIEATDMAHSHLQDVLLIYANQESGHQEGSDDNIAMGS
jgi:heptosyltransferase III